MSVAGEGLFLSMRDMHSSLPCAVESGHSNGSSSRRFGRCRAAFGSLLALGFGLAAAGVASAAPAISLNKSSYQVGEAVSVTFSGGPGNAKDWIGIYTNGITPSGNPTSLAWNYTNGTKTSGGSLTQGTVTFTNTGLGVGTYKVFFLANDGYTQLTAGIPLVITSTTPSEWRAPDFKVRHALSTTAYSAKVSGFATPATVRTFTKVSGPSWLTVSTDGMLGGTPANADVGFHTARLRVTGQTQDQVSEANVHIEVQRAGQEHVGRLNVMTYNMWKEWSQVNNGFQKGVSSIVQGGADVIGMQETSTSQAQSVADELGWYRATNATGSTQIVSRYPIVQTFSAGIGIGARIRLATSPLREINMVNCHLDYQYYGPYAARVNGATASSVLAEEMRSNRNSQMTAVIQALNANIADADNIPLLLTGDFNCPSHLDWTPATASSHGGVGSVQWPVSTRIHAAGLKDSFREIHPNPATVAGNSWSPIHKGSEAQDRIDFVYFKGQALRPLSSEMFTTAVEVTIGPWGVDVTPVAGNTWPSDHAAFITTFSVGAVDSDQNGLSDAWENRHYGVTGNDPAFDTNGDGLDNFASMILGIDPKGVGASPVSVTKTDLQGAIRFSVSDLGMNRGITLQRSGQLSIWETLWAFDSDPTLKDPKLRDISQVRPGEWSLTYEDTGAIQGKGFYRLRYQGQ